MLRERDDVGHAISSEEETRLLVECAASRSRVLHPLVVLLIETGARFNTIRTLQWGNVDLAGGSLKLGHDKTKAGSGRTIPLSRRGIETLKFWSQSFPNRVDRDFVFPREKYATAGAEDTLGFTQNVIVLESDPSRPIGSVKEAWEYARKRARLQNIRIHDIRHSAVSRMIQGGVPLPLLARIVGWSAGTMARMAARYGHFTTESMRAAVEMISAPQEISAGYPKKSPKSDDSTEGRLQ